MLVLTLDDKNKVIITDNDGQEVTLLFNKTKGKAVSVGFQEPGGQRNFNISRKKREPFPAGNN